jgi:hypothetical protein
LQLLKVTLFYRNYAAKINTVTKLTCIKSKCQNQKVAMNLLSKNLKENGATFVKTSLRLTIEINEVRTDGADAGAKP